MKKLLTRIGAVLMVLCLVASFGVSAFAADVENATINPDKLCSLTLYKYDWTNASKDGVWDSSYVSTGVQDANVERILGKSTRTGDNDTVSDLENGGHSNGYAVKGVEFSYLRVADIATYTESANDQHPDYNLTQVLYGFDKVKSADLLAAIGLGDGAGRYENADNTGKLNHDNWYYTSDTLNAALASSLESDATAVKNALESHITANRGEDASVGGTMPLTSEDGWTNVTGLRVGLYLLVETKVPEMVISGCNPFFVSLPMTSVNGSNVTTGGQDWMYDITLYPKNETGIVTLEKTVRESKPDTGKNNGSDDIYDGYEHNATASAGDILDYQFISTLPAITSSATYLTTYSFHDKLSKGLTYVGEVTLEWYSDKDCTNKVATWTEEDGKFAVDISAKKNEMSVIMTEAGLAEINAGAGAAGNVNGSQYAGYSNYTVRVRYQAMINSDATFIYGDMGNDNDVTLLWKRTSSDFYDTLTDDAHVYSYGLDITKLFSDKESEEAEKLDLFSGVKFKVWNDTDKYYVQAKLNEAEGVYYVTGHTADESQAGVFVPVTSYPTSENKAYGKIIVKGLEDDDYIITELETASGYSLLKDSIHFTITASDDGIPCSVYAEEAKLGVYQNDGHYYFEGCPDLPLSNIPQVQLTHNHLFAEATVDGNKVTMLRDTDPATGEDTDSANALVPLTVRNSRDFDLPPTGGVGTLVATIGGTVMICAAAAFIVFVVAKKRNQAQ